MFPVKSNFHMRMRKLTFKWTLLVVMPIFAKCQFGNFSCSEEKFKQFMSEVHKHLVPLEWGFSNELVVMSSFSQLGYMKDNFYLYT